MAPIDIVIDIINRHKRDIDEIPAKELTEYGRGKKDAFDELISELEGFKKLFN